MSRIFARPGFEPSTLCPSSFGQADFPPFWKCLAQLALSQLPLASESPSPKSGCLKLEGCHAPKETCKCVINAVNGSTGKVILRKVFSRKVLKALLT